MSLKEIIAIVLVIFLVVFAIQNTQSVDIKLLFWTISTAAVLWILVSFGIGFIVGWFFRLSRKKKEEILDEKVL
jgi:uncharacterized integral membrane protein